MWASTRRLVVGQPRSATLVGVATAAATLAGSLALLSHGGFGFDGPEPGDLDWVSGLLSVAASAPLIVWHRAPSAVFAISASASVVLGALGYPIGLPLGATAALYLFAASRDEQNPWTRLDTGIVGGLFLAYGVATGLGDGTFPERELFHTGLAWAVAWFAGERTRLRREHIAKLEERARHAEQEGERDRRLAVVEERARIARDLHDAAGHAINVIAVWAGTARMRQDPERSHAALAAIEELARRTVGEIDQIVGTLRDPGVEDGPVDAPPGLASLDTLVARHTTAGLDVSVSSKGTPPQLDHAVDQAAYRILQEALTNAARHGTGSARVGLTFGDAALALTVSNAAPDQTAHTLSNGHGLIGMRERATMLGGSFETERANGSFRVRARLPYTGSHA